MSKNTTTSSAANTASVAAAGGNNKNGNANNSKYSTGYLKLHAYKKLIDLIEQMHRSFIKLPKRYQNMADYCIEALVEAETDLVYSTENFPLQERINWLTEAIAKLHWVTIKIRIFYDLKLIHNTSAACLEKLESELSAQLKSWIVGIAQQNNVVPAVKRANLSLLKNIKK